MRHLSLDPETGLDPPGIRVRAAEGLDAASFFAAGYWIWSKVIENLAVLGYDTNNLFLASYDWRLSYYNLEVRDRFFTRLKLKIEQNKALFGKKTVIVAHSMGSSVFFYFMKWGRSRGRLFRQTADLTGWRSTSRRSVRSRARSSACPKPWLSCSPAR